MPSKQLCRRLKPGEKLIEKRDERDRNTDQKKDKDNELNSHIPRKI